MTVIFRHICSPNSLINILNEEIFYPAYLSPLAGDSGINGYIQGLPFNRNQAILGRGAEIIFEWHEDYEEFGFKDIEYPLQKNKLIRQGAWRAVIPSMTERKHIKVVGFKIDVKVNLNSAQNRELLRLKRKLSQSPIFLTLVFKKISAY